MKILECSTYKGDINTPKGDKRFSAMCVKVAVGDSFETIENHYQTAKRFKDEYGSIVIPSSWEDAKGRKDIHHIVVLGKELNVKYISAFYKLLWVKYLDDNPELVKYANGFDVFTDKFRGKSINCQAEVIRDYVKKGRGSIMKDPIVIELLIILKQPQ